MCRSVALLVMILSLASIQAQAQTIVPPNPQPPANKYNYCSAVAAQQSGWNGGSQSNGNAALRGGVAGAGAGALIGGMGGGDAGTGAAIGAAFGLIAGESRRRKQEQKLQNQQNYYYNVLNACMQQ
jgi:Glycine zipper